MKFVDATVDKSNKKLKSMTEDQLSTVEKPGNDVIDAIDTAFAKGDPAGLLAQKAASLH